MSGNNAAYTKQQRRFKDIKIGNSFAVSLLLKTQTFLKMEITSTGAKIAWFVQKARLPFAYPKFSWQTPPHLSPSSSLFLSLSLNFTSFSSLLLLLKRSLSLSLSFFLSQFHFLFPSHSPSPTFSLYISLILSLFLSLSPPDLFLPLPIV